MRSVSTGPILSLELSGDEIRRRIDRLRTTWPTLQEHCSGFPRGELVVLGGHIPARRHHKSTALFSMLLPYLNTVHRYATAAHLHYATFGELLPQEEYHAHAVLKAQPHSDLWAWAGYFHTHGRD